MNALQFAYFAIAMPFVAAIVLLFTRGSRAAARINAAALTFTLLAAVGVLTQVGEAGPVLYIDALAAHLAVLTIFVAMTTSWVSFGYARGERGLEPRNGRGGAGYAMQQCQVGALLLALLADNAGVTWIAIEMATIAGVLVLGLTRTAAWKFLLICGLGLVFALFGTALLSLAAEPALGPGIGSLSWSHLLPAAGHYSGPMLDLAFVFLLVGYGTIAALVPLHTWLPEAEAKAPDTGAIVAGGLMLNVALLVILRLRLIVGANGAASMPNAAIMTLGLLSLLVAGVRLWRGSDLRNFLAVSTIGQSGVAAFAFGLGGPVATFGGVLHITLYTLTRASICQCVTPAIALKGGPEFADLSGLLAIDRPVGAALAAALVSFAALPPFGLFSSVFLIVAETVRRAPLLVFPLVVGVALLGFALIVRLQAMRVAAQRGERQQRSHGLVLLPVWLQLGAVLLLGLAMPGPVAAWFNTIATANG
jgi:hydrogenase-4 component F